MDKQQRALQHVGSRCAVPVAAVIYVAGRYKTMVFSKLQALRFPNVSGTILRMFRLFPCPPSTVNLRFIDAVTGAAVKHSVVTV